MRYSIPYFIVASLMLSSFNMKAASTNAAKTNANPSHLKSHAQLDHQFNSLYKGNQQPLLPNPLIKLPTGSIHPEGWLRTELELMADGFSGHLSEISKYCKFEGSAWADPKGQGENGWEELPYWLKGYVDLGYVLGDKRIIAESKKWIDAILASQRENGYFGPEANLATPDIWPNMLVLAALRTQYEATKDARVLPFMTKYFHWLADLPKDKLLPGSWQKIRGGDNLEIIYWLYNRTNEPWLLDLAKINHERTADWTGGIPTWHGVNLSQGFREPAEYYQQSKNAADLQATLRNFKTIFDKYGKVPGGMFGADENAREGYSGPRQAAETCSMAEFMASDEKLMQITGEASWGDHCETVAFNSLPASMTADLKGLHYLTAPNLIQLDRKNKAPMVENDGDMFSFNPHDYRCCQHNAAFSWPYFSENLWMASRGNGLAAALYAPCTVVAKVGSGTKGRGADVRITETTDYPFDDTILFKISMKEPSKFPLRFRIPSWCKTPKLYLNKRPAAFLMSGENWVTVNRVWHNGDALWLQLPMHVEVEHWKTAEGGVSVNRGPLTYSLKIEEKWQKYGDSEKWPAYEVFPGSPWNYGLVLPASRQDRAFSVLKYAGALPKQPFTLSNAPVQLKVKAKRLPQWKQEENGFVGKLPPSPATSSEPVETVTLVPMGCARLRVSVFPEIKED